MKKFIKWLAKVFKVDITTEKIKEVEVEKLVSLDGTIEGNVTVKGNLIVNGYLDVRGEVTAHKIN